jgi:hypothetical protein
MFDGIAVDVALGLILFYIVMSLTVSATQEWIAALFGLRSTNLQTGIKNLLGPNYADKVYAHPLIKSLAKEGKLPSYVNTKTLSTVLIDILSREAEQKTQQPGTPAPGTPATVGQTTTPLAQNFNEVKALVATIQDPTIKQLLESLLTDSEDAALKLRDTLADWFDQGMDRISGWYKRRTKQIILAISVVLTVSMNASTVQIVEELWKNDALRTELAAQAVAASKLEDLNEFKTTSKLLAENFPIGWYVKTTPCDGPFECLTKVPDWIKNAEPVEVLKTLLGWLLTIGAISLGAPFWFDLLGKVANLKGSGAKPGTAASNQTAST